MTSDEFSLKNFYNQIKNILNEILIEKLFFRCITMRQVFQNFLMKIVENILNKSCFADVKNMLAWQLKG